MGTGFRPLPLGILWVGLVCVLACDPVDTAIPREPARGFIAVVGASREDALWPVINGTALRSKSVLGERELRVVAPEHPSVNAQLQLVRELQAQGMRGLCIQVVDPAATEAVLRRLANESTVVVTLMQPVPGLEPQFHCGIDEMRMGSLLADLVSEALREKGTLAVIHANSAVAYSRERYQSFITRMRNYPQLTILREFDCGADPARARQLMLQCMERYPRLNAWVAMDNWPLRGLESRPLLPPECRLITTNPHPGVWDALSDARCHAMAAADYDQMVRRGLEMCATAAEGRIVRWTTFLAQPRPVWAGTLHAYKLDWLKWCGTQE